MVDDEQLRQKLCLFFPIDICHIYQYMCIVGQRYFSLNLPIQMKRINWCGGHTVQFSNGLFSFCLCFPTKPEISAAIGLEIYSEMTSCDCISVIVILNYVYKNKECLKILAWHIYFTNIWSHLVHYCTSERIAEFFAWIYKTFRNLFFSNKLDFYTFLCRIST